MALSTVSSLDESFVSSAPFTSEGRQPSADKEKDSAPPEGQQAGSTANGASASEISPFVAEDLASSTNGKMEKGDEPLANGGSRNAKEAGGASEKTKDSPKDQEPIDDVQQPERQSTPEHTTSQGLETSSVGEKEIGDDNASDASSDDGDMLQVHG